MKDSGERKGARRKLGAREVAMMLSTKRPPGHKLLHRFLRELQDGVIPETETTKQLADAFEKILFDSTDPLAELDLVGGPGRRKKSGNEHKIRLSKDRKIGQWIEKCLPEKPSKGAMTNAIEKAAEKFHLSERTVWRAWDRWKEDKAKFAIKETTLDEVQRLHEHTAQSMKRLTEQLKSVASNTKFSSATEAFTKMLEEQQPTIDAYVATLSPKRRADFLKLEGQACYRIALAWQQKALTRK